MTNPEAKRDVRHSEVKAIASVADHEYHVAQNGALSIIEMMRCSHVSRWHIVRTARPQNIAEHMYRVYLLVSRICRALKLNWRMTYLAERLALHHDLAEIKIGDIPSPAKALMNFDETGICPEVDHLNAEISNLPRGKMVLDLCKLCDLTEAAYFLNIEALDDHGSEVRYQLWWQVFNLLRTMQAENPDYQWQNAVPLLQSLSDSDGHEFSQIFIGEINEQL